MRSSFFLHTCGGTRDLGLGVGGGKRGRLKKKKMSRTMGGWVEEGGGDQKYVEEE